MRPTAVLCLQPLPTAVFEQAVAELPDVRWHGGWAGPARAAGLPLADVLYGRPLPEWIAAADRLQWMHDPTDAAPP
ncbi:MAG: hypothetical protein ACRDD1_17795, partial [Planctomycetia bacterium]